MLVIYLLLQLPLIKEQTELVPGPSTTCHTLSSEIHLNAVALYGTT